MKKFEILPKETMDRIRELGESVDRAWKPMRDAYERHVQSLKVLAEPSQTLLEATKEIQQQLQEQQSNLFHLRQSQIARMHIPEPPEIIHIPKPAQRQAIVHNHITVNVNITNYFETCRLVYENQTLFFISAGKKYKVQTCQLDSQPDVFLNYLFGHVPHNVITLKDFHRNGGSPSLTDFRNVLKHVKIPKDQRNKIFHSISSNRVEALNIPHLQKADIDRIIQDLKQE